MRYNLKGKNLKLYIFSKNPNKEKLMQFYKKYKFVVDEETIYNRYLIMNFKNEIKEKSEY